jgi:hypothetical protein
MKPLLLYKPGALDQRNLEKARRAGYCCIETDNFEVIKIVDSTLPIDKEVLFDAAIFAIHAYGTSEAGTMGPKTLFGKRIAELLKKNNK